MEKNNSIEEDTLFNMENIEIEIFFEPIKNQIENDPFFKSSHHIINELKNDQNNIDNNNLYFLSVVKKMKMNMCSLEELSKHYLNTSINPILFKKYNDYLEKNFKDFNSPKELRLFLNSLSIQAQEKQELIKYSAQSYLTNNNENNILNILKDEYFNKYMDFFYQIKSEEINLKEQLKNEHQDHCDIVINDIKKKNIHTQ
jgi:hypothetical protein